MTERRIIAKAPDLNVPEDSQMIFEFIEEAIYLLEGIDATLSFLQDRPEAKDSLDDVFKVFHTIRGLAGFLNLNDIECLSEETEKLLDKVRKNLLVLNEAVKNTFIDASDSLKKLLHLLNEQVENDGQLGGTYLDVTDVVKEIKRLCKGPKEKKKPIDPEQNILSMHNQGEEMTFQELKQEYEILLKKFDHLTSQNPRISMQDKDREKNEKRIAFFVNTAHEIRVLLNVILGFSNLLTKGSLEKKQKDYVDTIISSSELLLNIVNGILDFSKIETGHLILESIKFNLNDLMADVLRIVRAKVNEQLAPLSLNISDDAPRELIGDPTRLKQILINLIDNAVKFTREGEIKVSISFSRDQQPLEENIIELMFCIEDTGIGIPEEKKEKIFESFTQADETVTRQYGGTGLGLSICRSFVEAMGGRIWAESKVDQGSKFIFTARFSLEDLSGGVVRKDKKDKEEEKASQAELERVSCAGVKVLVAEDSITNQELMQVYFEQFGCEGDFVSNGRSALENLKNKHYDVCFMDVEMPILNGIETAKAVRNDLKSQLPIVALTAAVMDEEREKCFQAGMTDYLAKPFDIFQLKRKIIQHGMKKQENV